MNERAETLRAMAMRLLKLADDIDRDAGELASAASPTSEPVSVWWSRSVEELDVDTRAANILEYAGIKTIGELATFDAIRRERNCGTKTTRMLYDAVAKLGIKPTWRRP